MSEPYPSPFNSALETGIRTLTVLVAAYPNAHDLSRLVQYDYLVVHSADANGPPSLHPPLPLRSGELLVRRGLVESGLQLLMSRSLTGRVLSSEGVLYRAEELAGAFLDNLTAPYLRELRARAEWVTHTFDVLEPGELDVVIKGLFAAWTTEFQPIELGKQEELF
ncbi:ABC-three component system middle component 2 [Methylocystis parvus]|uniref:ABC-three component system middle component 2 n=1 Tax=Methylocystis parvus TaxID=134 RepID=UPI003C78C828